MLLNHLFYTLKPLIPRRVQLALRRQLIMRKRKRYHDVWPILEEAGQVPEGWKGWPEGKQFAVVLTHDVDTAKGHDNCLRLADLEESHGFRSSFNFVPERYKVSSSLRDELSRRGFEIGIHGLVHDGKLFASRKIFEERAKKINAYLQEWGCSGFRSPAMHHNLDWIGELNVKYDASTFDTDPFEPQPDGVGTIFPFVVPRRSVQRSAFSVQGILRSSEVPKSLPCTVGRAPCPGNIGVDLRPPTSGLLTSGSVSQPSSFFVELPYTLPQDFTLFILMKERDSSIWKTKLEWIAKKGGMALLNAHPDYMSFDGKKCSVEEYPVSHYLEFIEFVQTHYNGRYWHPLPRDMSRFCARN
jgi:peptidoglycan/xylan/chitin deacetylase (PgdA/CDA1 family)